MMRKTLVYMLMVATGNLMLGGCGQYTTMSLTDVLNSNHRRVTEARTNAGENIVFDSAGAKYLPDSKSILGITMDGARAAKPIRDLEQVTLVDTTGEDTVPLVLSAGEIAAHFAQLRFNRIAALVTKQGEKYQFSDSGATVYRSARTISGTAAVRPLDARQSRAQSGMAGKPSAQDLATRPGAGATVSVPFDSVDYVVTYREGQAFNSKALLVVAGVVCVVIALVTFDPLGDSGSL
jgi:hypothetical protein